MNSIILVLFRRNKSTSHKLKFMKLCLDVSYINQGTPPDLSMVLGLGFLACPYISMFFPLIPTTMHPYVSFGEHRLINLHIPILVRSRKSSNVKLG